MGRVSREPSPPQGGYRRRGDFPGWIEDTETGARGPPRKKRFQTIRDSHDPEWWDLVQQHAHAFMQQLAATRREPPPAS